MGDKRNPQPEQGGTIGAVATIDEGTQQIIGTDNNPKNHGNTHRKNKKADRSELPKIATSLLVLSQIDAKMNIENYPFLGKIVNDSIMKYNPNSELGVICDKLIDSNGNSEALKWLHQSLGLTYDESQFELDISKLQNKKYNLSNADIQSAFDLLKNNDFATRHDESIRSELSGKSITDKSYFLPTKKGRQLLNLLRMQSSFTEKRDEILKALSYFEYTGVNIPDYNALKTSMNRHGIDISKSKISSVMHFLQNKELVETQGNGSKNGNRTIILSDKGRTFYDLMGITYAAQTQETRYDWETLERNIITQFSPVTSGNDALTSVNDLDLRFIPEDKHEGLWGAIHIMVNGIPICAAYANEDGKLMPSPETMYVTFLESQNNEISKNHAPDKYKFFQYIAGLNKTSEENISHLFADNNPYDVIEKITDGSYRNISSLVSDDGQVKPMGNEFYHAVAELFSQKEFDVIRSQGTQYHISGVSVKPTKSVL